MKTLFMLKNTGFRKTYFIKKIVRKFFEAESWKVQDF